MSGQEIPVMTELAGTNVFNKVRAFDAVCILSYDAVFLSLLQNIQDRELLNSAPIKFIPICCVPGNKDLGDL